MLFQPYLIKSPEMNVGKSSSNALLRHLSCAWSEVQTLVTRPTARRPCVPTIAAENIIGISSVSVLSNILFAARTRRNGATRCGQVLH